MAPEKRNNFLEADESEDDQSQGYDSEAEVRKDGGRSTKRRKVDNDSSDEETQQPAKAKALDVVKHKGHNSESDDEDPEEDGAGDNADGSDGKATSSKPTPVLPGVSRPLTKKNLVASAAAIKKSGVVYLSRIPPFLKPQKLRNLLEPYGTLGRIFCAPEDPLSHARRVRHGGNKKRSYTEGWVEFVNKKDAKKACELLNARNIGGKKGSYYYDDLWNLKYLNGFKWVNLTEQIAGENAERTSRMRAEISKTTKENKDFVQNVERAKVLDGMQAKAAAKKEKDAGAGDGEVEKTEQSGRSREPARSFKQIPLAKKRSEQQKQPEHVTRVLSKIF